MAADTTIGRLVALGYDRAVAEKLIESRPDLAESDEPPVLAYRGLSGGEDRYEPTHGSKTQVVVATRMGRERAIRKAQEYALGVFWGNTTPSPDGRYTVVEYQLPPRILEGNGQRGSETDSFERSKVPDERLFVSRLGSFHLRPHQPVSDIVWRALESGRA